MNTTIEKISHQQALGLISKCQTSLNRIGKITLESVSNADETTIQFLRNNSPQRLKELAQLNCFAADKIRTELNKKFGENNYVLIAVGRSLSSIAELMGKMGVDTKIIPLSGLRRADIDNLSSEGLQIYKTYLTQIGLSKTELKKNKDKKYILMDYTYYGRTLEKTEKILKRDDMLGNAENLIAIPVSEVLGEDYSMKKYKKFFEYCRFKDYACVGKLHVNYLANVYEKCSPERMKEFKGNITQGLRKLFWFNVFDSLKENSYKDVNPKAEAHALFVHHLSPKAVNNMLNRLYKRNNEEINSLKKQ